MPNQQTFRIGCHHANKVGANRRLCAVIANPPTADSPLTVVVNRNVQDHESITVGSGLGYRVAIPGREVATGWFAGTNVPDHVQNPPAIAPGEALWIELGELIGNTRRVLSSNNGDTFGVVSALLEFSTNGPATAFVVASEQNLTWSQLMDLNNAAARDGNHKRGTADGYQAFTEYEPIVSRVPLQPEFDDRRYNFLPTWMSIADELPANYPTEPNPLPAGPFTGEYLVEQHIHFGVLNYHVEAGNAEIVVNARGGVGCGAVKQTPTLSILWLE